VNTSGKAEKNVPRGSIGRGKSARCRRQVNNALREGTTLSHIRAFPDALAKEKKWRRGLKHGRPRSTYRAACEEKSRSAPEVVWPRSRQSDGDGSEEVQQKEKVKADRSSVEGNARGKARKEGAKGTCRLSKTFVSGGESNMGKGSAVTSKQ